MKIEIKEHRDARPVHGLLLIVLSGLLTLLVVLAVLFSMMVRTERVAAFMQLDDIRARLLTRSGVEYGVARLRVNPDPESGLFSDPADDWTYREPENRSLRETLNPSYHAGEPWDDVVPNGRYDESLDFWDRDLNGNGRYDAWSGLLRGTYQEYGETFKLRIEGEEGKINLNGGFLDAGDRDEDGVPDHRDTWVSREVPAVKSPGMKREVGTGWNGMLTRLLDNLVEALVPEVAMARDTAQAAGGASIDDPSQLMDPAYMDSLQTQQGNPFQYPYRSARTLGTWLISRRPEGGYKNWAQVETAILEGMAGAGSEERQIGALAETALPADGTWSERLKPYVTLHAWEDEVVHPDLYSDEGMGQVVHFTPSQLRKWRSIPPQIERRSPILVNEAAQPVLMAALTDVAFFNEDAYPAEPPPLAEHARIVPSVAQKIAKRIVEIRSGQEDRNRNGRLDGSEDSNRNGQEDDWEIQKDPNGNGQFDWGEDENQNGALDSPFRSWFQWDVFCDWMFGDAADPLETDPNLYQEKKVLGSTESDLVWRPYERPLPGVIEVRGTNARSAHLRRLILKSHFNPNRGVWRRTSDRNAWGREGFYYGDGYDSQGNWYTEGNPNPWEAGGVNGAHFRHSLVPKDGVFPYTTEWAFHAPSEFSIESFGELFGTTGSVRSYGRAWTVLKLFGLYRVSSQTDFVGGRGMAGYGGIPGEGALRTMGASMGLTGSGSGVSTVTYPEPMHLLAADRASKEDGFVMLATIEEAPDKRHTFLHHFDDSWGADHAGGVAEARWGEEYGTILPDPRLSRWDPDGPGLFEPDGVVMETQGGLLWPPNIMNPVDPGRWERFPAFSVDGNLPDGGSRGCVTMWVKPVRVYHEDTGEDGKFWWMERREGDRTQAFQIGQEGSGSHGGRWGFLVENGFDEKHGWDWHSSEPNHTREKQVIFEPGTGRDSPISRWNFFSVFWNIEERSNELPRNFDAAAVMNDTVITRSETSPSSSSSKGLEPPSGPALRPGWTNAFSGDRLGDWSGELFFLGDRGGKWSAQAIDELAVYDLGENPSQADEQALFLWQRAWQDGRYYKFTDARFASPAVPVRRGILRRVYWTDVPVMGPDETTVSDDAFVSVSLQTDTGHSLHLYNGAGEEIESPVDEAFRFQVHFHVWPELPEGDRLSRPLLQSPVFEDLTVFYEIPGGGMGMLYEESDPNE